MPFHFKWTSVIIAAVFCCGQAVAESKTFVGIVDGDKSNLRRVAIVVEDGEFVAYACSSDPKFNDIYAVWFKGKITDGSFKVAEGGVTLEGKINGARSTGTITAKNGEPLAFQAAEIVRSPIAGLYRGTDRVKGSDFVIGWIVDGRHSVVGSCHNKQANSQKVLKPSKPLPPPPAQKPAPEEVAQQEQAADEVLIVQADADAEEQVQAKKVTSVAQLPAGKKLPIKKK